MTDNTPSDTPRFAAIARESLDETGRAVWDRRAQIVNAPTGHFNVLMHAPPLCALIHDLETYFRRDSSITERDRELMTLAIVREANARFAWGRHERRAMECGVAREIVEALRSQAPPQAFPPEDRLMIELARALSGARQEIPQELFSRAIQARGQRWTIEAIALAGHYTMVAVLIHGYGVVPRKVDGPTF
jgi:alkylhydroperoxidase/carboxymuconolactone decarboxylase family protein YurZ